MDQVVKFEPSMKIKTGMYYIETDTYFPLRGNGWYRQHLTQYCLENNIIKLSEIKFVIYSSCSIKPDYFNKMVNHFEDVFNNDAKFAINSFIGCLKPKIRDKYKLRGLTQSQDEAFSFHLQFDGAKVHSIRKDGIHCVFRRFSASRSA